MKLIGNNTNWKIEYFHTFQDEGIIHSIIASKYDHLNDEQIIAFNKETIKTYNQEQLIKLIEEICDENDKFFQNKPEFVSFIKQKGLDGALFVSYDRKGFGSAVVKHFDNKKLRGPAQKLYTKILSNTSNKLINSAYANNESRLLDNDNGELSEIRDKSNANDPEEKQAVVDEEKSEDLNDQHAIEFNKETTKLCPTRK